MSLPFVTLDVFTRTRFKGNPLAVVTIPAAGPQLTQDQKQLIAREFNLSETVFVHDVADPETNKERRIDIFLTQAEINFAGHPTIGAAISLLPHGVTSVVTKAGRIPITRTGADSAQADIPYLVHLHAKRMRDLPLKPSQISAVAEIRQRELDAPIFSIVKGMSFVLVELPSLEVLAQVQQTSTEFVTEDALDQGWRQGFIGKFYFVRTGSGSSESGQPSVKIRARMIERFIEDPATGSASCCLATYLSTIGDKQTTPVRTYDIIQGVEMGKESHITVEVGMQGSDISRVSLAGPAVQVMQGHITV